MTNAIITLEALEADLAAASGLAGATFYNMPRARRATYAADPARIDGLRADMISLTEEAEQIQAQADAAGRPLTREERAAIQDLRLRFDACEAEVDAADSADLSSMSQGRKTVPDDVHRAALRGDPAAIAQCRAAVARSPAPGNRTPIGGRGGGHFGGEALHAGPVAAGIEGRRHQDLFAGSRAPSSEMPIGEFVRSVANGIYDPRLIRASQGESSGAGGGFAVPGSFAAMVWDVMLQQSVILPRARIFPTVTNSVTIPMPDIANRSVDIAGLQGRWVAEGDAFEAQTARLTQTSFRLSKLGALIKISNEWIDDVPTLNASVFAELVAATLTYDLDAAFFLGTGAGMPRGLLNAPSAITITPETGQPSDSIWFHNALNMWSSLHPQCQASAVWFCSPSVLPQLAVMAFDEAATDRTPVYLPANGAAGSPFATLMGRPLVTTEFQPAVGDRGDLILVDLSKYGVVWKNGIVMDRSDHAFFSTDQIALRAKVRCDAAPLWAEQHVGRGDAFPLSWCVMLADR